MRKSHKLLAALTAAAMGIVSLPAVISTSAADDVVFTTFATGFEDGESADRFTKRGDTDTSEVAATTEYAHTGEYSLCISARSKNWNGAQFRLDDGTCEPNTEYYVSAAVMGQYYTTVTLSMQYNDAEGVTRYSNLGSVSGNGWFELSQYKISFTPDMTDVYVYFEGGNTDNIYVDDFVLEPVPVTPIQEDIPSLSDLYSPYFKVGTAITPSNLSSKSFMNLVDKHFDDSITVGNEMKPDSVLNQAKCIAYFEENGDDTNPPVSFGAAAGVIQYCIDNNIPLRAHTLVWHSQTPDWFFKEGYATDGALVSAEKMLVRMENFIKNYFETLAADYPELNVYACDVVNEAWTDGGQPRNPGEQGSSGSSNSAWVQVFGDNSFIEPAFTFARKYAPASCKLYYNDYNEYMPDKLNAIYNMAADLKEKGLIDGIGMQSHLDVRTGSDAFPSISVYEKALAKYAELGLDIQITELDATIPQDQPTDAYLEAQAQYYSDLMDLYVKYHESISAVVFWGVTDDNSWRANKYPLLFDASFQAKPAYYSIVDGLEMPDITTTTTTTTSATETNTTTLSNPAVTKLGDVNCDGMFKVNDVILLNRFIAEDNTVVITETGLANADFDQSGAPNGDDAAAMLMSLAALD